MKSLAILLLVFASSSMVAQQSPAPASPTELTVATADIRKVRFDTRTGELTFEIKDRRYAILGLYEDGRFSDATIAKNAALLAELRAAKTVLLQVQRSVIGAERYEVISAVLQYDSLKGN